MDTGRDGDGVRESGPIILTFLDLPGNKTSKVDGGTRDGGTSSVGI